MENYHHTFDCMLPMKQHVTMKQQNKNMDRWLEFSSIFCFPYSMVDFYLILIVVKHFVSQCRNKCQLYAFDKKEIINQQITFFIPRVNWKIYIWKVIVEFIVVFSIVHLFWSGINIKNCNWNWMEHSQTYISYIFFPKYIEDPKKIHYFFLCELKQNDPTYD